MSEPITRAYFLWQFGSSYFKKRFYFDKKVVRSGSTHVECLSEWFWIAIYNSHVPFLFASHGGEGLSDCSTLAFLLRIVCLLIYGFVSFSSKVEHFLGIKRKPESGNYGAPKKPKI